MLTQLATLEGRKSSDGAMEAAVNFGSDGDGVDSMEHIGPETLRSPQSI